MNLNRRKFLLGAGAVVAAPAIAKIQNLMPVKTWVDVGYKGVTGFDAGLFYCPYVPLQVVRTIDADIVEKAFKTRYGIDISRSFGSDFNDHLPTVRLPEPPVRSNGILRQFASRLIGSRGDWFGSEPGRSALPDLRDERSPGELRLLQPKNRSAI